MSEQELVKEMGRFEEDSKWLHANVNSIREMGLSSQFVAVKSKKVIASDKDLNNLVKIIGEKGENPAYLVIEFIYPEGVVVLF